MRVPHFSGVAESFVFFVAATAIVTTNAFLPYSSASNAGMEVRVERMFNMAAHRTGYCNRLEGRHLTIHR